MRLSAVGLVVGVGVLGCGDGADGTRAGSMGSAGANNVGGTSGGAGSQVTGSGGATTAAGGTATGGAGTAAGGSAGATASGGAAGSTPAMDPRGPLAGTTRCEQLASCCNQITDRSQRDRCLDILDTGSETECATGLPDFVGRLFCGPEVSATVQVTYSRDEEEPQSFACVSPGDVAMGLSYATSNALIRCDSGFESTALTAQVFLLPMLGMQTQPGESVYPNATFVDRVGGQTYPAGSEASIVANITLLDEVTPHLVGTATASWESATAPGSPPLRLTMTFDVHFPVLAPLD